MTASARTDSRDEQAHDLPNLSQWLPLLQESLQQQGLFCWPLRGSSMIPTLPVDCDIDIAPPSTVPPLGALVVFAGDSSLVVHRLVHRTPTFLVTQGDNRSTPDPWLWPDQLLGVVSAAYLDGRRIWPGALEPALRCWWIGRAYALWLLRRIKRHITP